MSCTWIGRAIGSPDRYAVIHLDTHVVIWLYEGRSDLIPASVWQVLEHNDLVVSPMVELELEYLHEIGRATVAGSVVVGDLHARLGLTKSTAAFSRIIDHAKGLTWTRDPFDRLIVANALADQARLLTRDESIRQSSDQAFWDETPSPTPKKEARKRPGKRRARARS
jgi:PIN domain nuclease of toxin-antitoxin system